MKEKQHEDQWLDEIREQIQDFEAPIPADGWERVSSSLPQPEKPRFSTRWWSAAAAVLLCAAVGGGYYFFANEPDIVTEQPEIAETTVQQPIPSQKPSKKGKTTVKNVPLVVETTEKIVPVADETTCPEVAVNVTQQQEEVTPLSSDTILPTLRQEEEKVLLAMNETDSKPSEGAAWSFGLHLGGHGSMLDSGLPADMGYTSDPTYNGSTETNGPVMTDDVKASNHHASWSFGLSAGYQLSPKVMLESGLVYTLLTSDVQMKFSGTKEQRIQYLGVPLKLNYQIIGDQHFQFYASGGLMLEHTLSAERGKDKLDLKPWQWSSNLSAGTQLRVARHLYLYLEPGVNWYFDAEASAPSLRSESPVYFNLKGGLRIAY